MIAGLILAAGSSRRFGGDKLLAPLRGRAVIRWSAEALASEVDALYVVAPPQHPQLPAALEGLHATIVENHERDRGLSRSIGVGIAAVAPDVEAVVIALADQPLVQPAVVRALCDAWRSSGAPPLAIAPRYHDGRGHPVLFARAAFASLAALRGDRGARDLLDTMGDALRFVAVDASSPRDVDTPAMLAMVEAAAPYPDRR